MSDKYNPERSERPTLPALALTRAGGNTKPAPPEVYLLADHLDTALAAAEDIVNARLTWNSARRAEQSEISHEKHTTRDDVEEIRKLENTIIIRVLKSRERAEDVARADKRFRQLAKLYVAGTAVLLDAVEECGDSTDIDFATADTVTAYLRSRGLVDLDAPAPAIGEDLQVGEDFLIAKRIAAGPLMDLAAALLDALELHYDLFLDEDELAMAPQINRFEDNDAVVATQSDVAAERDHVLEATIDEIRDEAATQPDTITEPEVWAKLGTAGSVLPPVINLPVAQPLVHVSQTKAAPQTDTTPLNSGDENSEPDAVSALSDSEIDEDLVAFSASEDAVARSDDDRVDVEISEHVESSSSDVTEVETQPETKHGTEVDEEAEAAPKLDAHKSSDEADLDDGDDTTGDVVAFEDMARDTGATNLDASDRDASNRDLGAQNASGADEHVEQTRDETPDETACDDGVIITAANDDNTGLDDDDELDARRDADSSDDELSLVADNMDSGPDPIEALDGANDATVENIVAADKVQSGASATETTADNAAENDPEIEEIDGNKAETSIDAAAMDEDASPDKADSANGTKKKKSKSLLGRLSLTKP